MGANRRFGDGSSPIAEKQRAAVVGLAYSTELSPVQMANGAMELLDEIATGKITGEEDPVHPSPAQPAGRHPKEYIRHTSSAIFACPPGVDGPDDYRGRGLFE